MIEGCTAARLRRSAHSLIVDQLTYSMIIKHAGARTWHTWRQYSLDDDFFSHENVHYQTILPILYVMF